MSKIWVLILILIGLWAFPAIAVDNAMYIVYHSPLGHSEQIVDTWANPTDRAVYLLDSSGNPYYQDSSTGPITVDFRVPNNAEGGRWVINAAGAFNVLGNYSGGNGFNTQLDIENWGPIEGITGLGPDSQLSIDIDGDITGYVSVPSLVSPGISVRNISATVSLGTTGEPILATGTITGNISIQNFSGNICASNIDATTVISFLPNIRPNCDSGIFQGTWTCCGQPPICQPSCSKATNPSPADSAESVPVTANMNWVSHCPEGTHKIYFGDTPSPPYVGEGTSYDPPGDLEYGTMYYWRIEEWVDGSLEVAGDLWQFTTEDVSITDCNGNGIDDAVDISTGTSEDCNNNGIPDECELTREQIDNFNSPDDPDGLFWIPQVYYLHGGAQFDGGQYSNGMMKVQAPNNSQVRMGSEFELIGDFEIIVEGECHWSGSNLPTHIKHFVGIYHDGDAPSTVYTLPTHDDRSMFPYNTHYAIALNNVLNVGDQHLEPFKVKFTRADNAISRYNFNFSSNRYDLIGDPLPMIDPLADLYFEFPEFDGTSSGEGYTRYDRFTLITNIDNTSSDCNDNGEIDECEFPGEVEAEVELSPYLDREHLGDGPVSRCITFEFYTCDTPCDNPVVVSEVVTFNIVSGQRAKETVNLLVPPGAYSCVTARDKLHTLRSVATPEIVDEGGREFFRVNFTDQSAQPDGEDHSLIGGNFNDDGVINEEDFAIYLSQESTNFGTPDTDCDSYPPDFHHADITGDGIVSTGDWTFLWIHNLKTSEYCPCQDSPPGGAGGRGGADSNGSSKDEKKMKKLKRKMTKGKKIKKKQ